MSALFDPGAMELLEIPFGKHKGKKFTELDNDYLLWCLEKAEQNEFKPDWVNVAIRNEWGRRTKLVAARDSVKGKSTEIITSVCTWREECGCKIWITVDPASRAEISPNTVTYLPLAVKLEYCEEHK